MRGPKRHLSDLLKKTSVFLCVLCGSSAAFACTIPVFRFALDRWEADPYRLVIPASWATRPDMVKLLVPLRGNAEANLRIEESADPNLAEARLLFPHDDVTLWTGPLDATTLPPLLDSPARQELLQRILAGDSAIWVVCTTEADKAEADRIEKRLRFLEQVAALPPQNPDDPDSQLGPGPPLALKFSVLRVSLADQAEKHFAAMLAGPAHAEFIAQGKSFAAPVFGRGRVLGAWAVQELDEVAIEDASLFLIGRCSCRLKIDNPGWDVVLKADWERALEEAVKPAGPAIQTSAAAEPETVVTHPGPAAIPENRPEEQIPWRSIGFAAAAICALGGLVLWFKR